MTSPVTLMILVCLSFVGMAGAGWWILRGLAHQELWARRIAEVRQGGEAFSLQTAEAQGSLALRLVARLGTLLSRSGILPASTLAELEQTLVSAGMRQNNALAVFVGGKLLLSVTLPISLYLFLPVSAVSPAVRLMLTGGAAVVGLLLPDFIVRRRRAAYLATVSQGLPDALDMLVICSEAGLGLEMSLERVAVEISPAHPGIAAELKLTCAELRILSDRRLALTNMGGRTGLETLQRLGATLIQTMQYGTPLSQALRTLATELRYEMLMRFEAQAARLPVLLTVPMILFILPCIFIVVGGPAGLTVARTFIHH
jgi:tight adherence protein C